MAIETFVTNKRARLYNSNNRALDEYIEQGVICDCDFLWGEGKTLAGKRKVVSVAGSLDDPRVGRFIDDNDVDPYSEPPPSESDYRVDLHIYSSPDPDGAILGVLSQGDTVTLMEIQNDWFLVEWLGVSGWVRSVPLVAVDGSTPAPGTWPAWWILEDEEGNRQRYDRG